MSFGAAEESAARGHMPEDPDLTDCLVSRNKKKKKYGDGRVACKARISADLSSQLTPPSTALLEKLIDVQLQQKFQHFMELKMALQPVTHPHHCPDQSHSQLRIQLLSAQGKLSLSRP